MTDPEQLREAESWLRYAWEDLRYAEDTINREWYVPRHVCFNAQQAAEKVIKGALIFLDIPFPFTHNLDTVRNLLPLDWHLHTAYPKLAFLSRWSVDMKYPSDIENGTQEDARQALETARGVFTSIVSDLRKKRFTTEGFSL
jgi:HEPN domain-containing protein